MQILSELGIEGGKTNGLNLIEGNVELISNEKMFHMWDGMTFKKEKIVII